MVNLENKILNSWLKTFKLVSFFLLKVDLKIQSVCNLNPQI